MPMTRDTDHMKQQRFYLCEPCGTLAEFPSSKKCVNCGNSKMTFVAKAFSNAKLVKVIVAKQGVPTGQMVRAAKG